ncbi:MULTISPECIES: hypothetical protein [unclassified Vibrio]|uniref:hypothetical protein n=1 Tax=unclassified Vibrio TaxID=2614977 RepID=UPI00126918B9|nr:MULTISPECIES: hypothetical protein [unclassified Vibrio]QFT40083.1 hypothetical protein FIU99_27205 [Vibrio sp. THAF64]QGM38028.1 hypothetical protein GGC04_27410 [Vibrio sp. THAF191d]QGN73513.1 hypothetical protein GGC03_27370 [Vibrio sp. THAF191c]
MVNEFLKDGECVVWVDHRYNDNDGAYSIAVIWTGSSIRQENYSNGYNNVAFNAAEVNATQEQIETAAQWYIDNCKDTSMRDGHSTFIDCTVTLTRSRKAPNNTPLRVVNFSKGGFDDRYGHGQPDEICVKLDDGETVWVSLGCLKEVVKYAAPIWS